ncbi:peptidylprolyl isomerase [uncultured Paraglaciecola sp.]|uniref:peptidylprolyl isomerase n=1 Tax=uncultured Paraglaciecola sp. TaxID=1765024 RepID=UPI0025F129A6|nr:peptidylprolyl isomerase [uncultured Paraglaciecola sp.]
MTTRLACVFLLLLTTFCIHAQQEWRAPVSEDLIYIELETGTVIIELAPFMAPKHVARFKALVAEGFYDGLDFYRVIDGFVAQAGDMSEQKPSKKKALLKAEFSRPIPLDSNFKLVQSPDFIAPQTGYLNGFAAGQDLQAKQQWLLHCPGAVAFARGVDADSASTEFYIVIGQATRHLDRNMSTIGRVIYGMPALQALQRANMNNASGVIEDETKRSKILWAKLAKDISPQKRLHIEIQHQNSTQVAKRLASAKTLDNEFFHFKGNGNLDVCYYQLKTRLAGADTQVLKAD